MSYAKKKAYGKTKEYSSNGQNPYFYYMKIPVQYVNDEDGNVKAIQVSITEWKKVLTKLKKYEQALSLKTDLSEAFEQVAQLRKTRRSKETLKEFLNGL